MIAIIMGMFDDVPAAVRAVEGLQRDFAIEAIIHTGSLHETSVHYGGNQALQGAIGGGLVVGLAGASLSTFAVWPYLGYSFGLGGFMLTFLAASLYGIVAGAVAGASEWKSRIRQCSSEIQRGKSLVTCESRDRDRVVQLCASLSAAGGQDVQAA